MARRQSCRAGKTLRFPRLHPPTLVGEPFVISRLYCDCSASVNFRVGRRPIPCPRATAGRRPDARFQCAARSAPPFNAVVLATKITAITKVGECSLRPLRSLRLKAYSRGGPEFRKYFICATPPEFDILFHCSAGMLGMNIALRREPPPREPTRSAGDCKPCLLRITT